MSDCLHYKEQFSSCALNRRIQNKVFLQDITGGTEQTPANSKFPTSKLKMETCGNSCMSMARLDSMRA